MTVPTTVCGVVLTGGSSRRMGRDKAFVEIDGRAMVARVADALRAGGCDVVTCQGGDRDRLAACGLDTVPDLAPGAGPAAAIVQAVDQVAWTSTDTVVIAACDLGYLTGDAVAAVIGAGRSGVAVASDGGRRHLLLAVRRDAAASVVAAGAPTGASAGGSRTSVRNLLDRVRAVPVDVGAAAVHNVNRPGDLVRSLRPE